MKKQTIMLILTLLALFQNGYSQNLEERVKNLSEVVSVERMNNNPFFKESYIIMIKQPIDHQHPQSGSFLQRVILSHLDYEQPVIFITEGYNGDSEVGPRYLNELCPMLYANQLFVEHRFFGKSVPDTLKWKYLTIENAAADYHHILKLFQQIYPGNWISTGISKGGQASLYYRLLYPDDVNETVAYVAPLNYSAEDKRHDRFIRHKAGTVKERRSVLKFQQKVLKRKVTLLPLFEKYCREQKFIFNAPVNEIYDYCVMEYSFSFWQWCHSINEIPGSETSDQDLMTHFIKVISPDYFDVETGRVIMPFFVQAKRELGYYSYNPKPFKRLMQIRNTHGYIEKLFIPEDAVFPYNPDLSFRLRDFLKHKAKNILLIYGENDPWTASAAKTGRNKKIVKIVMKNGCHFTRILNLPQDQQNMTIGLIKSWMN